MTVRKILSTSFGNLGPEGDKKVNPFVAQEKIVLTTPDFAFTSAADMATKSKWEDGIKAGTVLPLPELWDYEDQSAEATYAESGRQKRKGTRQGPRRYRYMYDMPLNLHKKLQSYRNGDLRVFIFDEDGNVKSTYDGTSWQGLTTSLVNPEKSVMMPSGADQVEISPLVIDFADYKEWDLYGDSLAVSWLPNSLKGLTDVNLEVVGSPSSTEVIIRAYSDNGYDSDGVALKVPIVGIASTVGGDNDWTDDLGGGSVTDITDNGDGTYTFTGTTFATGTINLKAPSSMVSTGLLIKSTGAATVTI